MDDFGSGESSLNMLTTIPVDVLKFDRAFLISSTNRDDIQHAIVALKIKDEKYNLDGVYLSDPTDDNPQITSIREVNHYHGVLFRLKDTPLKEDYKDLSNELTQFKDSINNSIKNLKRYSE